MTEPRRTAILISGRGSNMAALLDACEAETYPASIALVVSDRQNAPGLAHASARGVRTCVLPYSSFADRVEFEARLGETLTEAGIELVCLAGFMRLLSPQFVEAWRDRLINIHPSLLPAFPGLHTHERALSAGVKLHGATVHFVRASTDEGPIVAQAAVPVLPGDTAEMLATRVLRVEHRLYPLALKLVASSAARVAGERVLIDHPGIEPGSALLCPGD